MVVCCIADVVSSLCRCSGFVVLFLCLLEADVDVIADGFAAVSSKYSRIFFAIWYSPDLPTPHDSDAMKFGDGWQPSVS